MKNTVLSAGIHLPQTDIAEQEPARADARISLVRVHSVKRVGIQPVYNMEVREHHNFAVNGGYVVHNCIDAVRYACADLIDERRATTFDRSVLGI